MPTDAFLASYTVDVQWDFLGDCGGYQEAVQGYTGCPPGPYGQPFVKTLNTVAGNKFSGHCLAAQIPFTLTTISQVQVKAKVWKTAVYAGHYRLFAQIGNQISYGPSVTPDGSSTTFRFSGALSRPGGGAWDRTAIVNTTFGVEAMGDGPWNGTEGSGGEIRAKEFYIEVTYTSSSEPVADFTADKFTVIEGEDVQFTDLSANAPTSWDWDFGDGTAHDNTQNPLHTYATQPAPPPNNKVTVTLIATNTGGDDTEEKIDYIAIWKTTDPVTAEFNAIPVEGDAPLTVTFHDQSAGYITDWLWDFGDGETSALQNPTHVYTIPDLYTVSLTVSNAYVNDVEEKIDYINVTDPSPAIDFDGTPTSGTRPLSVVFTPSITNNKEVTSWLWDFGDGFTSILESPTHIYTEPGVYTVSLTATNTFGSGTVEKTDYITVTAIAVTADFIGTPLKGYGPLEVHFNDLSTGDALTWNWDFGTAGTSTEQNPTVIFRTPGLYTVILVINQGDPNTDTETKTDYITVLSPNDWGRFFEELKEYLMEDPDLDLCESFEELGGVSYVLDVTYDRLARFVQETNVLRKETLLSAPTNSIYDLPQDTIRLLRVEIDGLRYEGLDQYQADFYSGNWQVTSDELVGYIFEPEHESLKMELVPHQTTPPTTVTVLYTYMPMRPTVPVDCFEEDAWPEFPIPYLFWWVIRFGVLADMLKNEGPFYDLDRAKACEEMWAYGVKLTNLFTAEVA